MPVPNDDRITRVGQVYDSEVVVSVVSNVIVVCHLALSVNRVEVMSVYRFVVVGLVALVIELVVIAQVKAH